MPVPKPISYGKLEKHAKIEASKALKSKKKELSLKIVIVGQPLKIEVFVILCVPIVRKKF